MSFSKATQWFFLRKYSGPQKNACLIPHCELPHCEFTRWVTQWACSEVFIWSPDALTVQRLHGERRAQLCCHGESPWRKTNETNATVNNKFNSASFWLLIIIIRQKKLEKRFFYFLWFGIKQYRLCKTCQQTKLRLQCNIHGYNPHRVRILLYLFH